MIGYKPLIHQLKDQLVHHFLHDEFSLSGSISAMKDLPFAYAVVRRPVSLDLRDRAGFPSPCVIDQKLRVDPEETVQDLLVLHRTPRHVPHCENSDLPQFRRIAPADPPEISNGLVSPQLLPVRSLIQFRDAHAVLIRLDVLGNYVHRYFGKVKIRSDAGCSSDPCLSQHIPDHGPH